MRKYQNDCCDCATPGYPCNGRHKSVLHLICDECGGDVDRLYVYGGNEYCADCLLEQFEQVDIDDE